MFLINASECLVDRSGLSRRLIGLIASMIIGVMVTVSPVYAQDKTITIAVEGDPTRLDPHTHGLWLTYRVVYHIFEGLVQQDLSRDDVHIPPIIPALAESWDISADGKTYTFNLRRDVKFHDGTDWNAEAAKFNFDRLLDPDAPHFLETAVGGNGWWIGDIESYEAADSHTFVVHLKTPVSNFLQRLVNGGYGSAAMSSPTAIKKYGEDFGNNPVGTGPFKLAERVFGEKIVLEKNSDYWDPTRTPKYDRLIYQPIAEDAARELALISGGADIIASPTPDSYDYIRDKGFEIVSKSGPGLQALWLNMKDPKLADVRVRQAMYMAIDREGLCTLLRLNECLPHYSIINRHGPGYDEAFVPYSYDPEKAKQLLADAGYPDGLDIRFEWGAGGAGAVGTKAFVEWVQRDWEKVGIRTELVSYDIGAYFGQMLKGMRDGTQVMTIGWGETSYIWLEFVITPDALPPNGYNSGYYDNPELGAVMKQVKTALTEEEMVDRLKDVAKIIADDVAWIPVYAYKLAFAVSPRIKGFVLAPENWQDLTLLEIVE
tara:strand:+ start:188 stop:1819 length:1632 start_codon:yes stop_codon:yes gene_type:complete